MDHGGLRVLCPAGRVCGWVALAAMTVLWYGAGAGAVAHATAPPSADEIYEQLGVDGLPSHHVVLLDTSTSMAEGDRYRQAVAALRSLLEALPPTDLVSLITFNDTPSLRSAEPVAAVRARFDPPEPYGDKTDIGAALQLAVGVIERVDAPATTVIAITDGEHDPPERSPYPASGAGGGWDSLKAAASKLDVERIHAYGVRFEGAEAGAGAQATTLRNLFPDTVPLSPGNDLGAQLRQQAPTTRQDKARGLLAADAGAKVDVSWAGPTMVELAEGEATAKVTLSSQAARLPVVIEHAQIKASGFPLQVSGLPSEIALPAGETRAFDLVLAWDPPRCAFKRTVEGTGQLALVGTATSPWAAVAQRDLDLTLSPALDRADEITVSGERTCQPVPLHVALWSVLALVGATAAGLLGHRAWRKHFPPPPSQPISRPEEPKEQREPMFKVKEVVASHRLLQAVPIPLSPLMVFLGRNDTGKTTALECLAAVLSHDRNGAAGKSRWVADEELGVTRCGNAIHTSLTVGPTSDDPARTRWRVYCCGTLMPDSVLPPVQEVVWLEMGERQPTEDVVVAFLIELERRIRRRREVDDRIEPPPRSNGSYQTRNSLLFDTSPRRAVPAAWVKEPLAELKRLTIEKLPPFAREWYAEATIDLDAQIEDGNGAVSFTIAVGLRDRLSPVERRYQGGELSAGVRAWLHLALAEAARELLTLLEARPHGDAFEPLDPPIKAPESRLYLIDEPERHLHPTAQRQAAWWLHELSKQPQTAVAVATHSPAFLELHRSGGQVFMCTRRKTEDGSGSVVQIEDCDDRIRLARQLVLGDSQLHQDLFMGGRIPLLVEGTRDAEYIQAAWYCLFGCEAREEGVLVVGCGGKDGIRPWVDEVFGPLFGAWSTIFVLTDQLKDAGLREALKSTACGIDYLESKHQDILLCYSYELLQRTGLLPKSFTKEDYEALRLGGKKQDLERRLTAHREERGNGVSLKRLLRQAAGELREADPSCVDDDIAGLLKRVRQALDELPL